MALGLHPVRHDIRALLPVRPIQQWERGQEEVFTLVKAVLPNFPLFLFSYTEWNSFPAEQGPFQARG